MCHGDRIERMVRQRPPAAENLPGTLQRLVNHADDRLGVLAARDLGHHATEARVKVDLARHNVGDECAGAAHDRGGRLVARGLDREDDGVS